MNSCLPTQDCSLNEITINFDLLFISFRIGVKKHNIFAKSTRMQSSQEVLGAVNFGWREDSIQKLARGVARGGLASFLSPLQNRELFASS